MKLGDYVQVELTETVEQATVVKVNKLTLWVQLNCDNNIIKRKAWQVHDMNWTPDASPLTEGQHTASAQPTSAPDEHGNIFVSEVGLHISNPDAEFLVKDESSTKCSASLAQQTNPLDGESASFPASSIDY